MFEYVTVFAVAVVVTVGCSFVVLKLSRRFHLAPEVRPRDIHQTLTPRLGGVAMLAGIIAAFAIARTLDVFTPLFTDGTEVWALLGACAIIAAVGILDDLFDIDWMIKLAAQLLAAGILAGNGVQIVSLPVGDTLIVASPTLNFVLTVFLMTLVMNAVNFVDGLDGLVAGTAIIANLSFFGYTMLLGAQMGLVDSVLFAGLIAMIIVGVCAGFLPFNWHRARMFMGDTGALLVGLMMATSTVSVTGQLNPAALDLKLVLASYIPIILPVAVLALPLADFSLAVLRRLRAGKSPFSADRQHLHHRLLDMGHSPIQAVLIFYLATAVISAAVLLVFVTQSYTLPGIVLVVGGLLGVLLAYPVQRIRDAAIQRGLIPWSAHRARRPVKVYTVDTTSSRKPPGEADQERNPSE